MQITFETRKRNTGFYTFSAGSSTGTQRDRERERQREREREREYFITQG